MAKKVRLELLVCLVNPKYSLPVIFDQVLEIHFESVYGAKSSDSVNLCSS